MKKGFISMYMVYSFFIVFIIMMFSGMLINNYKKSLLTTLKNDIKEELKEYHLEENLIQNEEESEKNLNNQ